MPGVKPGIWSHHPMSSQTITESERRAGRLFAYAAGTLFLALAFLHAL